MYDQTSVYPLDTYGFVAVTCRFEDTTTSSTTGGNFLARMFIPAGTSIDGLGTWVNQASTALAGGENSLAVYTDAGAFVAQTATDNTLWAGTGYRTRALTAPIAAQAADRYVWVGFSMRGMNGDPMIPFAVKDQWNASRTGTQLRTVYGSVASWPATITFASLTASTYLPYMVAYGTHGDQGNRSILLNTADPVPASTPVDTLIFRRG